MIKILRMDVMAQDFVNLCNELDDFMLNFGDVEKSSYCRYSLCENIIGAFVAYINNIPVGCAAYRNVTDGIAELKRVYVKKEYRGIGISSSLLKEIETQLKEDGYHTITLGTLLSLESAVNLYKNHGFKNMSIEGLYVRMLKKL